MTIFRAINSVIKFLPKVNSESTLLNGRIYQTIFECRNLRYASTKSKILTQDDKRAFMAVFPDIVRELSESDIPELNLIISKVLQYNVSSGKKIRGNTVVYSFKHLAKPEDLTEENIRNSQILGWCIEMLQAYFIICDDIMDNAESRRGRPCWYKLPEVGLRAINDAILIEANLYNLLRKYFSNKPYYLQFLELLQNTKYKTICGQSLDLNTMLIKSLPRRYTMDRYTIISKMKTSYYSYHLPVATAMLQAGIYDAELHRQAKSVLLEIGRYFQVQDDFLDAFGDIKTIGKDGTDIQDGKCTWLAVVALHKANSKQREIFEECYGSADPNKTAEIKNLYIKLGLPALYAAFEEETYNLIFTQIQQLSQGLPHDLFLGLLDRIHRRDK